MDKKRFSKITRKLTENNRLRKIIIIIGLSGMALIMLSSFMDFKSSDVGKADEAFSVKSYSTQIQGDIQNMISSIEGAGKTRVLLTMENSVEYVYLGDSATKTKEVQPVIRGVLVVCEGGDDPVVKERVTEAVTKALGISTAKICITKLSE